MSKLNAIILDMATKAKTGQPVKRTLSNGAEIGYLVRKGRTCFFVRRPTDHRPQGAAPPDAFTREAIVFWHHAEEGGAIKLKYPSYGRTETAIFALFDVLRWPGEGATQATIGEGS